jgi:hypothetical protein
MFITDVYRCTVTGTGETNLTADTSSYVQWPVYWRP